MHYITDEVREALSPQLSRVRVGTLHLFLKHTSASLSINECWDASVKKDMEANLNRLAPDGADYYTHVFEGPDDMSAHVKTSLVGVAHSLPVREGKLDIGTWQGVWLLEHRTHPSARKLVLTLHGLLSD